MKQRSHFAASKPSCLDDGLVVVVTQLGDDVARVLVALDPIVLVPHELALHT